MIDQRRVAIIHYWLVTMRGGERVLERLLHLFPDADIFTHVYAPEAVSDIIRARRVRTTFINRLPGAQKHYQKYLPLMPMALEELDLNGYDLVISCEAGPAKGVITDPGSLHVCYCHSPMRYLWDQHEAYRAASGPVAGLLRPWIFSNLRIWDTTSAARVDEIVANSAFVQQRIRKVWRREARVVHPPIDVDRFHPSNDVGDNWLWVGQMTPYKRADLAAKAFTRLGLPLLMVGDGAMAPEVRRLAGPTVTIVPRLSFDDLRKAYATCRALVFTCEEDFGLVPVEVMASGRPVLAFGRGGVVETVTPEVTGLFFGEQSVESLIDGVRAMEAWLKDFDATQAMASARRFSPERFDAGMLEATAA